MSGPRGGVFRYLDYAVDADRGVLTCRYELNGREFTERVTLPPGARWHTEQARAAARLVFLLSGVSYYKTAAPPVIDFGATALTGAEEAFLREFYLQGLGTRPSDLIAGIGPAIGADRYQVGPDVHEAVSRSFGPAAPAFIRPDPSAPARWLLDLPSANRHALREAGVPGPQIHATDLVTGPVPGHFFSDRTARPCGRLALVARLRPKGAR